MVKRKTHPKQVWNASFVLHKDTYHSMIGALKRTIARTSMVDGMKPLVMSMGITRDLSSSQKKIKFFSG